MKNKRGKVILDVSMPLDGFIAGPYDEIEPLHDWIFGGNGKAGIYDLGAACAKLSCKDYDPCSDNYSRKFQI